MHLLTKSLKPFIFLPIVLAGTLIPFLHTSGAIAASNDPTLSYSNYATIHMSADTTFTYNKQMFPVKLSADFVDKNPWDAIYQYAYKSNQGCDDSTITLSSPGATSGKLHLVVEDPYNTNQCVYGDYTLPIGNPDGGIFANWTSSSTIQTVIGSYALAQQGTSSTFSLTNTDNLYGLGCDALHSCHIKRTTFTLTVSGDKKTGNLTIESILAVALSNDTDKKVTINGIRLGGSPTSPVTGGGDGGGTTTPPDQGGTTGNTDDTIDCKWSVNPLTWLVCPVVDGINTAVSKMDDWISSTLQFDQSGNGTQFFSGKNEASYHNVWSSFRILATALIVIAGLIMVVSQALGFEVFDAYTVRKILPRLLVAVIGISLSWPLMSFMVDFVNTLGADIKNIMFGPFSSLHPSVSIFESGTAVGTGMILAGAGLGILGALSLGLTALLALFVAFLLITLRNMALIVILILAPIGIAAYILPNTQKAWKLWFDNFLGLLMVYPIIEAMIAAGHIFSAVALSGTTSSANFATGTLLQVMGLLAYIAPYFALPIAFRMATGAIGTIAGFVNDQHRGAFDRLKKYRGNKINENMAAMRNYSRVGDKTALGRGINTFLGAGTHPMDALRGRKGIRAGRYAGRTLQGGAELEADQTFQANKNDDNFLLAVANRSLAEQKLAAARSKFASAKTADDRNKAQAEIDARSRGLDAAGRMNINTRNRASTRQAALGALTRTGYQFGAGKQGYQELASTIQSISGGDKGAYTAMMDEAQYNLKGAGRFDLGGINHGAGYSYATGVGKSSGYTLGNGKVQSFYAGAAENLGAAAVDENGETHKDVTQLTSAIQSSLTSGETNIEKLGQWHSTLIDASMGGTVGNKAEAIKQLDAIEAINDPALKAILEQNRQRQRRGLSPDEIKSTET